MITIIISILLKFGVAQESAERFAKPVMYAGLVVLVIIGYNVWKSQVIQNAVSEANVEFLEDKDEATGKADAVSDEAKAEHEIKVKRTEELIDEALREGCIISDYLASNGELCRSGPVSDAGTE